MTIIEKRKRLKKILLASLFSFFICFAGNAKEFQDGDIICFFGDSITHGGTYHAYILEFYATRYPERKLIFHNCGIGGDTASGALKRLDWDLLNLKPSKTIVMFGMNDVGVSFYGKENPDEKNLKRRKLFLQRYKESMGKISDVLKKNNIEIIYITPTPYDQTVKVERKSFFGANDALGICAEFCRKQAAENNAGLVDFYKPMTDMNLKKQKEAPSFSLIGKDRVHPHSTGHYVMAYLFLKSQGVSDLVSAVSFDFKSGKLLFEKNCKVSEINFGKKTLSFDCLEKALPLPVFREYMEADKLIPVTKELNNEVISVSGLPEGNYELLIDGKKILKASSEAWAKGVNIAVLSTPQQIQAVKIHKLVMKRYRAQTVLRGLVMMEIKMRRKNVDINNPKAREMYLKDFLESIKDHPKIRYYTSLVKSYRKYKPQEKKMLEKITKLNKDIYRENKPQKHHYKLKVQIR